MKQEEFDKRFVAIVNGQDWEPPSPESEDVFIVTQEIPFMIAGAGDLTSHLAIYLFDAHVSDGHEPDIPIDMIGLLRRWMEMTGHISEFFDELNFDIDDRD